jgi:hypothetical protein
MRVEPGPLREALWVRSGGYCEVCGRVLHPEFWAWHHRKLRKHGGPDCCCNALAVHHECHNGNRTSIHLSPKISYENGWLVRSSATPTAVPVMLPGQKKRWLTCDGQYLEDPPSPTRSNHVVLDHTE